MRIIKLLALLVVLAGIGAFVATAHSPVSEAASPAAPASAATDPLGMAAAPVTPGNPDAAMHQPEGYEGKFPQAFTERSFGKSDAPVTLIEYAALTCPHCAHLALNVLPRVKQTYVDKGLVRIVFRDFPFNEIGLKAAMAARCAPEANYYDFLQALFSAQDKWSNPAVGETLLKQMSGFAGLSPADYDECTKNNALSDMLLKVRVAATNDMQITSTPTILVQGTLERIVGAQEYEEYQKVIDRQLTKLGIALPEQAPATPEAAPATTP